MKGDRLDFNELKSLDLTDIDAIDMAELSQPWEQYDTGTYGITETADGSIRVAVDSFRCIDADRAVSCADAIGTLPTSNEAVHMRIGWRHSMGDIIPAILRLAAPVTISELHVATLTYSKINAHDWSALLDDKKIGSLTIVCSQYFAKTSPHIYEPSIAIFKPRNVQMAAIRSHCKILLARLSDGRTITATGSANTRSAKTTEQVEIFAHPQVYQFHRAWFEKVMDAETRKGEA